MQDLNITLVQADLHWEDPVANHDLFDRLFAGLNKTDLLILPEMFSTGFTMHADSLAESMEGRTVSWMRKKAGELQVVITGSLIIREGEQFFNRLIWMQPDGSLQYYDKRHLFSLAKEEQHYTAGSKKIFPVLKGWKILPLVCYDLRFPVWSRNTDDFDLLVYAANWPQRRIAAWEKLLPARAIENQCYVAGVNRTGPDGNEIPYNGQSAVYDPMGEKILSLGEAEGTGTSLLQSAPLETLRTHLPFLRDRDSFEIRP